MILTFYERVNFCFEKSFEKKYFFLLYSTALETLLTIIAFAGYKNQELKWILKVLLS
jgi:hypothetical protein